MNKISKKLSKEQGYQHYKLCTVDYSALQTRLATIDTALNEGGIDKNLLAIYEPGGLDDLHCMTAFNTFVNPLHRKVYDAVDENGNTWTYLGIQEMKITRDGQEMTVLGKDILPTDSIVGYVHG